MSLLVCVLIRRVMIPSCVSIRVADGLADLASDLVPKITCQVL